MERAHWREPSEKPLFELNGIYFLTFNDGHWELHMGGYNNYDFKIPATGEIEHREYVEESYLDMDITYKWSDVKKWCYYEEFEDLLKLTF